MRAEPRRRFRPAAGGSADTMKRAFVVVPTVDLMRNLRVIAGIVLVLFKRCQAFTIHAN